MELSREELEYQVEQLKMKYSNLPEVVMILTDCLQYIENLENDLSDAEQDIKNLEKELYEYECR